MKPGYVYIMTNQTRKVLYIGVTSDISKRLFEHKDKIVDGFSKRYHLNVLIYVEVFDSIQDAREREYSLKGKTRKFKESLIKEKNPGWQDISNEL